MATLDEKAKSIFFLHYVVGKYKSYDYLKVLYKPTPANDHLIRSVKAVSLAYFSHRFHSPEALEKARRMYVSALHQINKALQCPATAIKDVTLLSALLLDLYEKMTNHDPYGTGAWTSHVKGAMTLVKMRGDAQFKDPVGLRMIIRFSTSLIISCNASYSRVPPEMVHFREQAERFFPSPPNLKWRMSGLVIEWTNLMELMEVQCIEYEVYSVD